MVYTSIFNHHVSDPSHDFFTVTYEDDQILTLLTASPSIVHSWISDILRIHRRRLHRLVVGLDIEWRPNFSPHQNNPPATLQLSVGRRCLIFQLLHSPYIPPSLFHFLRHHSFTFVGVGIHNDAQRLQYEYGLDVANMADLRDLAADRTGCEDLRNAGLAKLAKEFMGCGMNKPRYVRLSRWDNLVLDSDQVMYGAVDSFLSFEIGRRLMMMDY